ncbi:hypothetical protein KUA55_13030 [Enterococcus sp. ALS3]|uniref:Lipoprotein n=1 Tax=Enterococcus alishanensis TaxID=1303817 RepID=A0ABS6TF84_9ENTE|nr:hypothetical protein [Enterococcus alishanensis]MBV7391606.1 hypothetical protein [Enterococcus alishanensis]
MKKKWLGLIAGAGLFLFVGCGGNQETTEDTPVTNDSEQVSVNQDEQAEKDAKTLLNFLYQGKRSEQLRDVTNQSADSIDSYLVSELSKKQDEMFAENENRDDYYLVIDDSNYYASDIVKDYAEAYLKQTKRISFDIQNVNISGDEAIVVASYYPIAGLQEANPIGAARTELFGGIDEDTFIRKSQNKDLKTIKSLITLKLYAIYYGELDYDAEKVLSPVELEFTLTKKGDHFMANDDVIYQLVKESRISTYQDNSSDSETTESLIEESASEY